jgi:hypothetical protein
MHHVNPALALRRNRRILRSKVYLLLTHNRSDQDFDLLKASLNKEELEEVIEDACYYIPFPDKLNSIKEQVQTIEEIVDNSSKPRQPHLKIIKKKLVFRKPNEMMPFRRNYTLKSQKTLEKLPFVRKRETLNLKEQIAKGLIRKIDLNRTLLDTHGGRAEGKGQKSQDVFLKYDKVFSRIEDQYHQSLKQRYFLEVLRKKRRSHSRFFNEELL